MSGKRIAIAGLGRMGQRYVQAIRKFGHEIGTLFDPAETPWVIAQEPDLAAHHTRDLDVLLKAGNDVVVIATTANYHVSLLEAAIGAGYRRLVVEKPFSQSHLEAIKARSLAQSMGARVIVNHGRRYCPNVARLKALDGSKETGKLRALFIRVGGGAMGCVGTHWIDLCNNLMGGLPERVFAEMSAQTPANNRGSAFFDPGGTAMLSYSGGRRAIIDAGDDIGIVAGAEFVYETAQVSWRSEGAPWSFRRRKDEDLEKSLTLYGLPLFEADFPTIAPDIVAWAGEAIADALSDAPPRSGLDLAVETMETFAAIRWAASTDAPVRLPIAAEASAAHYPIP